MKEWDIWFFFFKKKSRERYNTIKKQKKNRGRRGVGWRERQCGFTVVFENETQESRKKKKKK